MSSPSSASNSPIEELRWLKTIPRTIEEEREDDYENSISIFDVPKILMHTSPLSYTPHRLALGPYHHERPELFEMERYKLSATKRVRKQLQILKFHSLVDHFINFETKIRACYNKYLNFNGETLAWMIILDASFLIKFLQVYADKECITKPMCSRIASSMCHFFNNAKRNCAHNEILRDIIMLENQIPLFLIRKKDVSPFKTQDLPQVQQVKVSEYAHLLHFMYDIIVPKMEESVEIVEEVVDQDHSPSNNQESEECSADLSYIQQFLNESQKLFSSKFLHIAPSPVVLTRYTEPMNGIIDTKEDVELLRKKGIILNHMKSDQKVADIWNEMNKSIRLTKVPFMDKVIEDISKYYDSTCKVNAGNYMKHSVYHSWKLITLLASILLLLLTTTQTFCSAWKCSNFSG
ncbi:hypothetical protein RCOM_0011030 [Ricinus communis]|uniref:Uncharacterized protein n=1 Tax=Ricinus communis TaxID=3988 RepID=B9SWT6_RICCO|nr:hypothetical protein RCOM_0011030 [Ricinus communis]